MDAIPIGPFVLPMDVVLLLAGTLVARAAAAWSASRRGRDPWPVLWKMLLAGLVGARLSFAARHVDLYRASPLALFDFRDGGLDAFAGLVVAGVVAAELTRHQAQLGRPVFAAAVAGCFVFFGGAALNRTLEAAGAPLPNIDVTRADGAAVALRSYAGRPLVVNLWATWCPPCRREMPALAAAQRAHPDVGFVFVNQGEAAADVRRFLASQGLQLSDVLTDPARQLSARTGVAGYPTTLFYDSAGRLVLRHMGELSQATIADKLARLRQADRSR